MPTGAGAVLKLVPGHADTQIMELLSRARRALNVDDDALAAHRDRIRLNFSWMTVIAGSPFMVLHLVNANWPLFGVNTAIVGMMFANAWALRGGREPLIPFWALCCLLVVGACASVLLQGFNGLLWAFPALFMFFFVLPRAAAMVLGLALLLCVTAASTVLLGFALAARVFMSLGFVLIMINVVLNVIGELQRALVAQATTDPLTGAYNRRHLQDHLARRVMPDDSSASGDALLAIDIDHFKRINDEHGHASGDLVLRRLVTTIEARRRSGDLLFRTGGEEFVLLLPRISLEAAKGVAEALRERLAQAELLSGQIITVSIGVSALAPGQSLDGWMQAADSALYEAKRTGRNRVVVAAAA